MQCSCDIFVVIKSKNKFRGALALSPESTDNLYIHKMNDYYPSILVI
jgi:hypothetical protein